MTEMELLRKVVEHLISIGYPRERIATEYIIPSKDGCRYRYRVDIAILDRDGVVPLALFEVKHGGDIQNYEQALKQLRVYVRQLHHPVRTYFVYPVSDGLGFSALDVTADSNGLNIPSQRYPRDLRQGVKIVSYDELIGASELAYLNVQAQRDGQMRKRMDGFALSCHIMLVVLVGLFIRDYYVSGWRLHWESLAILGGCLILLSLPSCDIMFKDVSIRRRVKKDSEI